MAVMLLFATVAGSQSGGPYDITRSTVDSGGNTASGGAYELTGTIGQADTQRATNGQFLLQGGFWHGSTIIDDSLFSDGFEN